MILSSHFLGNITDAITTKYCIATISRRLPTKLNPRTIQALKVARG